MQRRLLILLLLFTVLLAACSFSMDYVVINTSANTANVTYTIAPTSIDPLAATGIGMPAMLPFSKIPGREWEPLSPTQFNYDRSNRTVTVSLPPYHGLLIYRGAEWRADSDAAHFITKEIRIVSSNGEMTLTGDEVYKSFVVVPKRLFSFGPPTLATLAYK
jgi:hypothetical protein